MKKLWIFGTSLLIVSAVLVFSQQQEIRRGGSSGSGATNAANWTASGTTNSTLAGTASVDGLVATNIVKANVVDVNDRIRFGPAGAYANVIYWGNGDLRLYNSAGTAFGTITLSAATAEKSFQQYQGTLTHAGTTTLDFNSTTTDNYMSITGAVTLATSNLATNRNYSLTLYWTGITNAPLTTPAWLWQGYAPTNLWPTNKTFTLLLKARGANDTNVTAVFGGQY